MAKKQSETDRTTAEANRLAAEKERKRLEEEAKKTTAKKTDTASVAAVPADFIGPVWKGTPEEPVETASANTSTASTGSDKRTQLINGFVNDTIFPWSKNKTAEEKKNINRAKEIYGEIEKLYGAIEATTPAKQEDTQAAYKQIYELANELDYLDYLGGYAEAARKELNLARQIENGVSAPISEEMRALITAGEKAKAYYEKKGITPTEDQLAQTMRSFLQVETDSITARKIGNSVIDAAVKLGKGYLSAPEHIMDFVLLIGGLVPLAAGNDEAVQWIKDFTSRDLIGEAFESGDFLEGIGFNPSNIEETRAAWQDAAKWYKGVQRDSYLEQLEQEDHWIPRIIGGIPESIGGMMFDAGIGRAITEIAKAADVSLKTAQTIYKASSLTSLGLRSAGSAAGEAYNEGASYLQGLGYGALRGGIEMASEGISDFNPFYSGANVARGGLSGVAKGMIGEGMEEVVAGVTDPLTKTIYKGKDALKEYGTPEFWFRDLPSEFAAGALTAAIASGATGQLTPNNLRAGTAVEAVGNADTTIKKITNQWANGKLTDAKYQSAMEAVKQNYAVAEKSLQEMTDKARAKLFEQNPGLKNVFNDDGSIRTEVSARLQAAQETKFTAGEIGNVSPNLRTTQGEQDVRRTIENANNSETLRKNGEQIKVYDRELTAEQRESFKIFATTVNKINQATGGEIGIVVVESNKGKTTEAFVNKNDNVIYVNVAVMSEAKSVKDLAKLAVEELTHLTQGESKTISSAQLEEAVEATKEFQRVTEQLTQNSNAYGFTKAMLNNLESKLKAADMWYKQTEEAMAALEAAREAGDQAEIEKRANELAELLSRDLGTLTAKEAELEDERHAHAVAEILANDNAFINEYVKNPNLAERFLANLEKVGGWFKRLTSKEARTAYKQVQDIKTKFLDALAERGYQYKNGKVIAAVPDEKEKTAEAVDDGTRFSRAENNSARQNSLENAEEKGYNGVRTKKGIADLLDTIIETELVYDDGKYEEWRGVVKGKGKIVDQLMEGLKTAKNKQALAEQIADLLIDQTVMEEVYSFNKPDDYLVERAQNIVSMMKQYRHRIKFDAGLTGEVKYKYDKAWKGYRLQWAAKEGATDAISPDQLVDAFDEIGIQLVGEGGSENAYSIFLEAMQQYENARATLNSLVQKTKLSAFGTKEEIAAMKQRIVYDLLQAIPQQNSTKAEQSAIPPKTQLKYKVDQMVRLSVANANLARELQGFITGKGEYVSAAILNSPEMRAWIGALKPLEGKALYNADAREVVEKFSLFYNENNPLLEGYLDDNVLEAIDYILENKKAAPLSLISLEEMQAINTILSGVKHLYKIYDTVVLEGKRQSLTAVATESYEQLQKVNTKMPSVKGKNAHKRLLSKLIVYGVEPRVVINMMEGFNQYGVLSRAYREILKGETQKKLLYMQMMMDIDTWMDQHKKYNKRLAEGIISFNGNDLTVGQAISLYELSKRDQAKSGLFTNGITYVDVNGIKHEVKDVSQDDAAAIKEQFTEEDKEFIKLTETFFYEKASEIKKNADKEFLGYTNALERFYFPITREGTSTRKPVTDSRSMLQNIASIYSFSFNKALRPNATNALEIKNVYDVISNHAEQLSSYAGLFGAMKTFDQIWNKNVAKELQGKGVMSARQIVNNHIWDGADDYFTKLFGDIDGTGTHNSNLFGKIYGQIRSNYAKFQLGANIKTFFSQITSYPEAFVDLDFDVLTKGFLMKADRAAMDKYCPYVAARYYNKDIVKAEGMIDNVGKIGDVMTKPIQVFDRFTIARIWNACQLQVQKNSHGELKVGTEENMKKAGEMLEEVVRRTQPDFSNAERSGLMRSNSEIAKTFTMFSSAQLKQLSRFVEALGRLQWARSTGDKAEISKAKGYAARATAGLVTSVVSYAAIGMIFKAIFRRLKLYDEPDEEKFNSFMGEFAADIVSGGIGLFPILRDVYNTIYSLFNGYERNISNFVYDIANDVLVNSYKVFDGIVKAANGESVDWVALTKKIVTTVGEVSGIPTRNLWNQIAGLFGHVHAAIQSGDTGTFLNTNYVKQLNKAIEAGDMQSAETIMDYMMSQRMDGTSTKQINQSVLDLYKKGYNVLPRIVKDEITYDGETYTLTAKQKTRFQKIYGQSTAAVQKVVSLQSYKKLDDAVKAKTIKRIYDMYYGLAIDDLLGTDTEDKTILFSYAFDIDKLALIISQAQALEADKDKNGNTIAGSKKKKVQAYINGLNITAVQKYMIMGYLGYRNAKGEEQVKAYINRLGALSKAEKKTLFEYSGY